MRLLRSPGGAASAGLIAQAIGQYFTYRLLVIPAVALLMVIAMYVAIRSNRAYAGTAGDNEINLGQESLTTRTQQGESFTLGTRDASQGNDEDLESAGSQGGYSNVSAMTASYADWGGQDNGILSAT